MGRTLLGALAALVATGIVIALLVTTSAPPRQPETLPGDGASPASTGPQTQDAASEPALCGPLSSRRAGRIVDGGLQEISGLVVSRRAEGVLWAVQDSGAAAELAALSRDGRTLGRWQVAGASNLDWEALATGPGPAGDARLYLGDIGDNAASRETVTVWVVDEPASPRGGGTTAPAQAITLRYPDGPRDAETLLVDPRRGDLLVISKETEGGGIYAARAPLPLGGSVTLQRIADAPLGFETGGDVSADGRVIAVRGYTSVAAWQRRGDESLLLTLRRKACGSPSLLLDGQGETLALSRGGRSATTIAEGVRPPINQLRPKDD